MHDATARCNVDAMVRKSKWLDDLKPATQADEAARKVIASRLDLVQHYLPLAVERSGETPEYVHQLRVSTRRAMAAVETFAAFLPQHRAAVMTKKLRKLRRAAGDARDYDVLGERLVQLARQSPEQPWAELLVWVEQQRESAQRPIRKMARKLSRWDLAHKAKALAKRVRLREQPAARAPGTNGAGTVGQAPESDMTYGAFAQKRLGDAVNEFFASADQGQSDVGSLHAFRIQGKRLRYAIELLAAGLDPSLRQDVYPQVEALQERLGAVNDHATAFATFERLKQQPCSQLVQDHLKQVATAECEALAGCQAEFAAWWSPARIESLRRQLTHVSAGMPANPDSSAPDRANDPQSLAS